LGKTPSEKKHSQIQQVHARLVHKINGGRCKKRSVFDVFSEKFCYAAANLVFLVAVGGLAEFSRDV